MAQQSEPEAYQKIVAAVKAKAAEEDPHNVTGDQVQHEIARRWAKHKGRKFDSPPAPPKPGGVGSTAVTPPPTERRLGPMKPAATAGKPIGLPEEAKKEA